MRARSGSGVRLEYYQRLVYKTIVKYQVRNNQDSVIYFIYFILLMSCRFLNPLLLFFLPSTSLMFSWFFFFLSILFFWEGFFPDLQLITSFSLRTQLQVYCLPLRWMIMHGLETMFTVYSQSGHYPWPTRSTQTWMRTRPKHMNWNSAVWNSCVVFCFQWCSRKIN